MQAMLDALKQDEAQRQQEADHARLRTEYIRLLSGAEPASAARVSEIARTLGLSAGDVRADLAAVKAATGAAPQTAPPTGEAAVMPPPDLSKLHGYELIALACQEQTAVRQARESAEVQRSAAVATAAGWTPPIPRPVRGHDLLALGIAGQTPRLPNKV